MTTLDIQRFDAREQHGTALLPSDDTVWIAVCPQRWDIATWLWWWLAPADSKAWVVLTTATGARVRTRAVRIARRYVRIGNVPKPEAVP